jgi:hypothetical protein
MKSQIKLIAVIALLMLGTLACSLLDKAVNQATGGGDMQSVSSLWSDVPALDGLQKSEIDMPLPVKLLFNTIIGNLGKLNPDGTDQTTGKVDWIAFTSDKTPADIETFYTPERMSEAGWEKTDTSSCFSGTDQGVAQIGMICVFSKSDTGKMVQLAIIAAPDEQTKKLNVFYLRLELQPTPVPN